jgi:hypothetical protein
VLSIWYKVNKDSSSVTDYSLGDPITPKNRVNPIWVTAVQADGEELEYIHWFFKNLPCFDYPNHEIPMNYYGDMAKFIVANWDIPNWKDQFKVYHDCSGC